ncbi:MAG: Zn-ribbon containing protein [Nanoarchaeota archaeon]
MPHQCTRCGEIYLDASKELLKGCNCGSRFFYYIKQEKLDQLKREVREVMTELEKADKDQIEKDIRELTGMDEKPDEPVILDLESVKVIKPGKFEIDIVSLFSKNRPLIYKLGEGKYIIDLSSLETKGVEIKAKPVSQVNPFSEIKDEDEEEDNEKIDVNDDEEDEEENEENKEVEDNKKSEGNQEKSKQLIELE